MDEQVDRLAETLTWVVDDEQAGTGHYSWHPGCSVDPDVVGFLINYYRTSTTALADVLDRLQTAERDLQARTHADRLAEQLDLLDGPPPGRPVVDVPLPDVVVMRPGEEVVPRGRTDPPARTDPPGQP